MLLTPLLSCAQTQTLVNLKNVLEAAGSSMSLVTKCTVYLANFDHFAAMNAVYASVRLFISTLCVCAHNCV